MTNAEAILRLNNLIIVKKRLLDDVRKKLHDGVYLRTVEQDIEALQYAVDHIQGVENAIRTLEPSNK
jgi:hypothetical protein